MDNRSSRFFLLFTLFCAEISFLTNSASAVLIHIADTGKVRLVGGSYLALSSHEKIEAGQDKVVEIDQKYQDQFFEGSSRHYNEAEAVRQALIASRADQICKEHHYGNSVLGKNLLRKLTPKDTMSVIVIGERWERLASRSDLIFTELTCERSFADFDFTESCDEPISPVLSELSESLSEIKGSFEKMIILPKFSDGDSEDETSPKTLKPALKKIPAKKQLKRVSFGPNPNIPYVPLLESDSEDEGLSDDDWSF